MLYGLRMGIVYSLVFIAAFVTIGFLQVRQVINPKVSFNEYVNLRTTWFTTITAYVFMIIILLNSVNLFYTYYIDRITSYNVCYTKLLRVLYYSRRAGLIADIALLANMFFIAGVLASIGASLTLPGIAGIVLTIGMSVDANVLIYERIREEMAAGKGVRLAVTDGYKNAYSAIIDANVTTLITGIISYNFV